MALRKVGVIRTAIAGAMAKVAALGKMVATKVEQYVDPSTMTYFQKYLLRFKQKRYRASLFLRGRNKHTENARRRNQIARGIIPIGTYKNLTWFSCRG